MDKYHIKIGVVADDFTGASDAASFIKKGGLATLLLNGTPTNQIDLSGIAAIVIALKTRTMAKKNAVELSIEAFEWLKSNGVNQIYSKYCSTLDSTKEGNIGPIIDSVLERYNYPYTIIAPSLPANGRVVRKGHLYVNGVRLHKSSMKDHPLTPMWDSKISNLMSSQGKYKCVELSRELIYKDIDSIMSFISCNMNSNQKLYIIPDYIDDNDGERIAYIFKNLPFLTGGSGLLEFLAKAYNNDIEDKNNNRYNLEVPSEGKVLILAGSVSQSTQEQVNFFIQTGNPSFKVDPLRIFEDEFILNIHNYIENNKNKSILIYSSDTPQKVKEYQRLGKEMIAKQIEKIFGEIAKIALKTGYSKIVVAGGETSGAVMQSLKYDKFIIGKSIAPGVPIMVPISDPCIRVILKSGNFGDKDFFANALSAMEGF